MSVTALSNRKSNRDELDAKHDKYFKWVLTGVVIFVLIALAGAALTMLWGGRFALMSSGVDFFTTTEWNPVSNKYGALVPIF